MTSEARGVGERVASKLHQSFPIKGGAVRRGHSTPPHRADGTVAQVDCGDGAWMTIMDPTADTHMEWSLRYGDSEAIKYSVASVLSSLGYLLDQMTEKEAARRLTLLRRAHRKLLQEGPLPERATMLAKETNP